MTSATECEKPFRQLHSRREKFDWTAVPLHPNTDCLNCYTNRRKCKILERKLLQSMKKRKTLFLLHLRTIRRWLDWTKTSQSDTCSIQAKHQLIFPQTVSLAQNVEHFINHAWNDVVVQAYLGNICAFKVISGGNVWRHGETWLIKVVFQNLQGGSEICKRNGILLVELILINGATENRYILIPNSRFLKAYLVGITSDGQVSAVEHFRNNPRMKKSSKQPRSIVTCKTFNSNFKNTLKLAQKFQGFLKSSKI